MTLIILLILIILLVFVKINQKDILFRRMLFFFIGYWGLELVCSSVGISGYYKPSFFAVFLLLVNLVMFTLGFCLFYKKTNQTVSAVEIRNLLNTMINSRIFTILLIIATTLSVYYFSIMRTYLSYTGSMEDVRRAFFDHSMLGQMFLWQDHLFLEPMRYICVPLFGYMVFFRRNWKLVLVSVFLLCYSSLGAGRLGYLRLLLGVVFVIYCVFNDTKFKIKYLIVLGLVLVAFLWITSYVTAGRAGSEMNREDSYSAFLHYLCGPVSAFDYAINSNYVDRMGGHTMGRLSFSAIEGLVKYIWQAVGVPYETALERLTLFKQGERIPIGPNSTWNALYTNQLFSWLDFGVFGCFFFPFIFGVGVKFIFYLFNKYRNWPFFMLMASFFQLCMESTIDFRFTSPFTLLVFCIIFYLGKRNNVAHT